MIEEFLKEWKNQPHFGERKFEKLNATLVERQTLYLIYYKAVVSVDGVNRTIEKKKFFQTNLEGMIDKGDVNPIGDKYVCRQILDQLEADFFKDYNEFIEEQARKKTCP